VAGSGRKNADAALAVALAGGATVEDAACSAGVSPRTAHRRLADPTFSARVDGLREQMARQAVARLASLGGQAADALAGLLGSEDERVRLGAARAVLDGLLKASGLFEFERRLRELEEQHVAQTVEEM
jgi:hypothetical protein